MKSVSRKDGYILYQKFFADLVKQESLVVVWQIDGQGHREIFDCVLSSFKFDAGTLHLTLAASGKACHFNELPVYCYSQDFGVIFKTESFGKSSHGPSLRVPEKICYLETPDVHLIKGATAVDLSSAPWRTKRLAKGEKTERDRDIFEAQLLYTLDEEDKLFADAREAPRARPTTTKIISCQLAGQPQTRGNFVLFDLSRGGLGFKIPEAGVFTKGGYLEITALEGQELDNPLLGEIMSVRDLAPEEIGWKVGVKFVDEVPRGDGPET